MLISDQQLPSPLSENIIVMSLSKTSFADLASERLGFDVTLDDPYKICDFKPLFGKIFKTQLNRYKYWGYCDLDIVFGDISKQIHPVLVENPDIISFYMNFLSGPFCLYRNTENVINLFSQCPEYKSILQDPDHKAFDEHIPKKISIFRIFYNLIFYFLKFIFAGPRYKLHGPEIHYQFQWHAKKLNSRRLTPSDMTDIVHKAYRAKQIKVIFKDLIKSDRAFRRQGHRSWKISWQKGYLRDRERGDDLFAFHFIDSKNNPEFVVEPVADYSEGFTISDKRIECILHEATGK
jgi:hypothetical protein